MSKIKSYLQREVLTEWAGFPPGAALWQNRLWYYLWCRIRILIARSFSRAFLHSIQFAFMAYFFPVFEWAAIFIAFQLLLIYEGAVWGVLEPLRKELREHSRLNLGKLTQISIRYRSLMFRLALVPWLGFALWWSSQLSRPGRVFGFHDLMILVFVARTSIQTVQTWIQAVIFHRDRFFISFSTWFVPLILPVAIICLGLNWGENPWWIPLGYVVEALATNAMIWRRWIKVDLKWFQEPVLIKLFEHRRNCSGSPGAGTRLLGYGVIGAALRAENWVLIVMFGMHDETVLLLMGLSPLLKLVSQIPNLFWVEMTRQRQPFFGYFLRTIERRLGICALAMVGAAALVIWSGVPLQVELFIWVQLATLLLSTANYVFLKFFFKDASRRTQNRTTEVTPNGYYHRVFLQKSIWRHLRSRKVIDRFFVEFPDAMLFHRSLLLPAQRGESISPSERLRMIRLLRGFFDHVELVTSDELMNPVVTTHSQEPVIEWVPYRFDLGKRQWSPSRPAHPNLESPRDQAWLLKLVLNHVTPVGRVAIGRLKVKYRRDTDAITLYLRKNPS